MKTYIALGTALLLTLGTAVAGTLLYGDDQPVQTTDSYQPASTAVAQPQVTPELIAMWKATAASTDYIAPKVPI